MAQKIYGVDVGTYSIKIAELERTFKTFELVSFYEHPIIYSEILSKEEAITATLEKMAEDYNLAEGQTYTALPGTLTATRLLDLPFGSATKIDQTIEFEIEGAVPVPIEDIVVDYHIVESSKTESTCMMSYVKKADLVKFLNIFSGTEMEPRFVGCEPVELGSVMNLGIIQPEGAYAILDIGHTKSCLAIFLGPKLYFARTLSIGGLHLTQSIARKLQIPIEEAERFKLEIGQVAGEAQDDMTRRVSQAIQESLEKLLIEVRQTFMNIQENEGQVIQAIYLCGGTSRLTGIDHFFSYELRKNVSHLDCLDFPFNKLADSDWCRAIIPQSLALAYRGAASTKLPDIQFRRGEFSYRGDIDMLGKLAKQAGVLVGTIIFFVLVSFGVNYFVLSSKVEKLNKSTAQVAGEVLTTVRQSDLQKPDTVISILNGRILEGRETTKALKEKFQGSYLNVLLEISKNLPPRDKLKIDVDDLLIDSKNNRINIKAKTDSSGNVEIIEKSIAKSPIFKNVNTKDVESKAGGVVQFNIDFQFGLPDEEEPVGWVTRGLGE